MLPLRGSQNGGNFPTRLALHSGKVASGELLAVAEFVPELVYEDIEVVTRSFGSSVLVKLALIVVAPRASLAAEDVEKVITAEASNKFEVEGLEAKCEE